MSTLPCNRSSSKPEFELDPALWPSSDEIDGWRWELNEPCGPDPDESAAAAELFGALDHDRDVAADPGYQHWLTRRAADATLKTAANHFEPTDDDLLNDPDYDRWLDQLAAESCQEDRLAGLTQAFHIYRRRGRASWSLNLPTAHQVVDGILHEGSDPATCPCWSCVELRTRRFADDYADESVGPCW